MKKIRDSLVGLRKKIFPGGTLSKQLKETLFSLRADRLWEHILNDTAPGITSEMYGGREIIVSLASYGRRLRSVALTIETLLHQTMPPNRIILNIDPQDKPLRIPIALQRQIARGLEIYELKEQIRSYKKLIPTMERFPEALVITVDDDLLYKPDLIERLYDAHLEHPEAICAMRVHTITLDQNRRPRPYGEWHQGAPAVAGGPQLFATSGAGTLFPPGAFGKEAFDREAFMSMSPTADDVWFHAMALYHDTPVVKAPSHSPEGVDYDEDYSVADMGLLNENLLRDRGNDRQIKAVWDRYDIYSRFK